jgi:hypothetical protein
VPSKSKENRNQDRKEQLSLKLLSKLKTIKGENDKGLDLLSALKTVKEGTGNHSIIYTIS